MEDKGGKCEDDCIGDTGWGVIGEVIGVVNGSATGDPIGSVVGEAIGGVVGEAIGGVVGEAIGGVVGDEGEAEYWDIVRRDGVSVKGDGVADLLLEIIAEFEKVFGLNNNNSQWKDCNVLYREIESTLIN